MPLDRHPATGAPEDTTPVPEARAKRSRPGNGRAARAPRDAADERLFVDTIADAPAHPRPGQPINVSDAASVQLPTHTATPAATATAAAAVPADATLAPDLRRKVPVPVTPWHIAAAVRLFFGHREGAEGLAKVGVALFLVAFAPTIIRTLWAALVAAGGGQ